MTRRESVPALAVPILYFGTAHLCLILAFAAIVADPAAATGFFLDPRLLAVVHLITIGWVSGSILGALYIVGPLALRMPLPAGWTDLAGWGLFTIGASGMVTHFWIGEPVGMAWSALMTTIGFLPAIVRAARRLPSAPIEAALKAHLFLAFANLGLAALLGLLLGSNRAGAGLPVNPVAGVGAHAHLAALGWATMMIFGTGYRLFPMFLPAAMPRGGALWASALLLEAGVLTLGAGFLFAPGVLPIGAVLIAAAAASFLSRVVWMLRNRRPAPAGVRRGDPGMLQAALALASFVAALAIGALLSIAPEGQEWTLRAAAAYGVLGLVGFLAQMVAGVGARLLPLFAAVQGIVRSGGKQELAPHDLPSRPLQAAALIGWAAGVPLLAAGVYLASEPAVRWGALALLGAALCGAVNTARVLRVAVRRRPGSA